MFGFARPKLALLVILKNSARNSTRVVSVMGVVLNTEKSNSARPGPSNTPRPTFPQVPAVGGRLPKAFGPYQRSTVRSFTAPSKLGSQLGRSGLHCLPLPDSLDPTTAMHR